MGEVGFIERVPATPEYVLDVLLTQTRQGYCRHATTPPETAGVTLDSPLETLLEVCGFDCYDELLFCLLDWFDFRKSARSEALFSAQVETTRDFCESIAARAMMPNIRLVSICGNTCVPASVFLAIRSLLAAEGADVSKIAPSTTLHEYTRAYPETFLGPIARLSPGSLSDVEYDDGSKYRRELISLKRFVRDIWGIPVLLVLIYSVAHQNAYADLVAWAILIYVFLILITVKDENALPVRVGFGELRTFRDLAELIAAKVPVVGTA
jgi:hypothetical protein